MGKFSKLRKHAVDPTRHAKFVFDVMDGSPALIVRSATETNTKYMNDALRRSTKSKARARQIEAGKANVRHLREIRDDERESFAKFVIVGWEGVTDDAGKEVAFTEAECLEWLTDCPDHLFDELRKFCGNESNFADVAEDASGLAGN